MHLLLVRSRLRERKGTGITSSMLIRGTLVHETLPRRFSFLLRPAVVEPLLAPAVTHPYPPPSASRRSLVRGVLVRPGVSLSLSPSEQNGSLASEILPVVYTLGSCYGTWECSQAWQLRTPPRGNTRRNGPRVRSDGIDEIASEQMRKNATARISIIHFFQLFQ